MPPLASSRSEPLSGTIRVPGDKSISHRALILGALAVGETQVDGLLEGDDVLATAAALRQLGADIERQDRTPSEPRWLITGCGVGGLSEPGTAIDMGNSGTGARLLMGVVATHPFLTIFTGDPSLSARPMARVADPLRKMGAKITSRAGCRLPVAISGTAQPLPVSWQPSVPSAQVKSAILLAGLNTPGTTRVIEAARTRDHTERLLTHFGAHVSTKTTIGGLTEVSVEGYPELEARPVIVPGDVSSAAFPLVGALIANESNIVIENIGVNPLRVGLIETLVEMGADIQYRNERVSGGEPVADISVRAGPLRGVEVPASRAPSMIDEYPILAVAAAFAEGPTIMRGLAELRVKESDRLASVAEGLEASGVRVETGPDTLTVHGTGGRRPLGGETIRTHMDHRIAMSFMILGLISEKPIRIDDGTMIGTSFPGFVELMNGMGASIEADVP
ncbi:MAG: 3-phosphoshikimate 1-carboxyvinyltransferase [Rhodospirillales bacterium]|nr:3-phosphoshikimate 1-carboxyvinyltransferase [Rhodospirillales bacterium]